MIQGSPSEDAFNPEPPAPLSEADALLADVQHLLPAWLPMLERLQSDEISLAQKLDTLKRIKPYTQGTSGFHVLPQLVNLLRSSQDVAFIHALVKLLGEVKAFCLHQTLVDITLATGIALFEKAVNYRTFIEEEPVLKLRCTCIRLLGFFNNQAAIIPLMGLLNDHQANYRVRLEAAESLGRLKNPHAVQPLLRVLKDDQESSMYLQESAVKALGLLGDIRALSPLLDLFESKNGVREKCQFLIERILDAVGKLAKEEGLSQNERNQALNGILSAVNDPANAIRLAAVEALSAIGDFSHLAILHKRLFDENMEVAHAALTGVFRIGGMPALKALLDIEQLPRFLREEILDFLVLESEDEDEDEL
jgi:HEAT repeat protein